MKEADYKPLPLKTRTSHCWAPGQAKSLRKASRICFSMTSSSAGWAVVASSGCFRIFLGLRCFASASASPAEARYASQHVGHFLYTKSWHFRPTRTVRTRFPEALRVPNHLPESIALLKIYPMVPTRRFVGKHEFASSSILMEV